MQFPSQMFAFLDAARSNNRLSFTLPLRRAARFMLVMTRKRDESILVDRNIEITVVEIRGDKVRLGVNAPKEVPVHRREVFETIHGIGDVAASPPQAAATSHVPEFEEGALVALAAPELALLDRFRDAIRAQTGAAPRREQTLQAILSAVNEGRETIGRPFTLEDLQRSIAAALKGSAAT